MPVCPGSVGQEFEEFSDWFADTDGKVQAARDKSELARRTTEQFQEALFDEQQEMARRIKHVDKQLQAHVSEWAEIMALLRAKYGTRTGRDSPKSKKEKQPTAQGTLTDDRE